MIALSDLRPFSIDYGKLTNISYYYWMSEYILTNFTAEDYSIEVVYDIPGFGAHWGGLFVSVKDRDGRQKALCHTGLVYHPETEIGVYFETENCKNVSNYEKLWKDAEPDEGYQLNKDEPDFLKFFFPADKVSVLMNAESTDVQIALLREYYDACFRGILRAANK